MVNVVHLTNDKHRIKNQLKFILARQTRGPAGEICIRERVRNHSFNIATKLLIQELIEKSKEELKFEKSILSQFVGQDYVCSKTFFKLTYHKRLIDYGR